jgi:peptidoglycan biosynthesis protein MviN/MurJ (putative lipid II flippase)
MHTPLSYGGLALSNSIAALAEGGVLIRLISRRLPALSLDSIGTSTVRILAASLVMGLPVAWLAAQLDSVLRPMGTPGQAVLLAVCALAGAALYAAASLLFRSEELHALWRLVKRN